MFKRILIISMLCCGLGGCLSLTAMSVNADGGTPQITQPVKKPSFDRSNSTRTQYNNNNQRRQVRPLTLAQRRELMRQQFLYRERLAKIKAQQERKAHQGHKLTKLQKRERFAKMDRAYTNHKAHQVLLIMMMAVFMWILVLRFSNRP